MMVDTTSMTALAALGGSLVGGILSSVTTYFTQRHQGTRERLSKDLDQRSTLYTEFNQVASELLLDSLDHTIDRPDLIVRMMTLVGRVRIASSAPVIMAAETAISELLASYRRPAVDYREQILNDKRVRSPAGRFYRGLPARAGAAAETSVGRG
ncbi:hypothetical protein [Sphingomonas sp. PAMC 26621]|uniref:hypothetical protein n=1 Tax=Sphingomonas sp. PAMC 26621 TaxID=1112213 RepID=UPI000289B946|nr:hypothetical protein [Sphingomonas sp. PAMC 26621]